MHCREGSRLLFTFEKLLVYLQQRRKEIHPLIGQRRSRNENNNYQTILKMSKISQKDLDKAVEAAKEEFKNSFIGKNGITLDFFNAFNRTTAEVEERQAAFILGQLDYYRHKLSRVLDETLKQFIDEVQLTADRGKVEIYEIYLKTSECSQELVAFKESDGKKKRFIKGSYSVVFNSLSYDEDISLTHEFTHLSSSLLINKRKNNNQRITILPIQLLHGRKIHSIPANQKIKR